MLKRFLVGLTIAFSVPCAQVFGMSEIIAVSDAAEMGYAPQTNNERDIKVTATLQSTSNTVQTWDIEVTLEIHTKNMNDDLTKSSVLVADGKQYLPLRWEGAPPGGHHRKGKLRFKAITPQPRSVELQIRLADDASPRSFKWLLK